jgi:hypothetical protein
MQVQWLWYALLYIVCRQTHRIRLQLFLIEKTFSKVRTPYDMVYVTAGLFVDTLAKL